MIRKLLHIPQPNTNCVCWWHFFFPPKYSIYPDGSSIGYFENGKKIVVQRSHTFRNYIVRKWYEIVLEPSLEVAKMLKIEPGYAFQLGMPIAFDATAGAEFTTQASPRDQSHTCTGDNRLLWVGFGINNTGTDIVTGITYNAISMTRSPNGFASEATNAAASYFYYLAAPATGANTVSTSWSGANRAGLTATASYTGCAQTGIPDSDASAAPDTNAASPRTITTTVVKTNCWLVGIFTGGNVAFSAGTGTTARTNLPGSSAMFGGTFDSNGTVGTGSQSLQVTWTGNGQCRGVVASFAPVAILSGTRAAHVAMLKVGS